MKNKEEMKVVEAFQRCADVRLPEDFADRIAKRVCENKEAENKKTSVKTVFTHIALVAASLTLLLGFVPNVFDQSSDRHAANVARWGEIRSVSHTLPQDGHLTTLAFLGFCREAIRLRVRSWFERSRKRKDEE